MRNPMLSDTRPHRHVIDGAPSVSFYPHDGKVELCPFPACLKSCLETMGEQAPYETIMGASGAAFRLLWNPNEWDGGNVDLLVMAEEPLEPHRRAFEAVGHSFAFMANAAYRQIPAVTKQFQQFASHDTFVAQIVASLYDRQRPVLALGVIGPPECSLVTGYDDAGEVLIGWSFFQDMPEFNPDGEREPSGYFRKRDWFADTAGIFVVGDKVAPPPQDEFNRKALTWALHVARTPNVHQRSNGFDAYTAWATALLRDADAFATNDLDRLFWLYAAHNDAMTMVAEGRWYASLFLANIARDAPRMAAPLLRAASCYAAEHDLMWKIWSMVGGAGFTATQVRNLANAEVRSRIAPLILQARDKDCEAADYIERALA